MDIRKTPLGSLLMLSLMSGSPIVDDTATGNPVTFETTLARPLKSLIARFLPVQEGSGDPSPENVRNISGWTGLDVWHGGKNLLDPETLEQGGINIDGSDTSNPKRIRSGYIPVKENTKYFLSAGDQYKLFLHFYDSEKASIGSNVMNKATAPSGACFARAIIGYQDDANISPSDVTTGQLELGTTATAFEPYKPITKIPISFPSDQTVFGGSLDLVSGVLSIEWFNLTKTWGDFGNKTSLGDNTRGTLSISSYPSKPTSGAVDAKCNIAPRDTGWSTDSVHFYTNEGSCVVFLPNDTDASTEIQVTYPLATPQEIQLSAQQITALVGNNTIWSDGNGDCSVTFQKKG